MAVFVAPAIISAERELQFSGKAISLSQPIFQGGKALVALRSQKICDLSFIWNNGLIEQSFVHMLTYGRFYWSLFVSGRLTANPEWFRQQLFSKNGVAYQQMIEIATNIYV